MAIVLSYDVIFHDGSVLYSQFNTSVNSPISVLIYKPVAFEYNWNSMIPNYSQLCKQIGVVLWQCGCLYIASTNGCSIANFYAEISIGFQFTRDNVIVCIHINANSYSAR